MHTRIMLWAMLMVAAAALSLDTAQALTCSVPSGTYATIQAAVNDPACMTINVTAGIYHENVTIPHNLTLGGASAAATIVDGGKADRVFVVNSGLNVTIARMTIRNGQPASGLIGGGIFSRAAALELRDDVISDNAVTGGVNGGGIANRGVMTLTNTIVSNNKADFDGAGIENLGTATLVDSTVSGNSAQADGGGIHNDGNSGVGILNIYRSNISGNSALGAGNGGGVDNFSGSVSIVNSTLSGNIANFDGGGIDNAGSGASMALRNVTVAYNIADNDLNGTGTGGGVNNFGGNTFNFFNTIVANNLESDFDPGSNRWFRLPGDCSGNYANAQFSIVSQQSSNCTFTFSALLQYADPKLGPLANNGGPTLTHALLAGSPAINMGTPPMTGCTDDQNTTLTTDQRGWARPYPAGGRCDIGAYERGAFVYLPLAIK